MCIETMVDVAARELEHRSGRAAPRQHHPGGGDAIQDRTDLYLRLRRLSPKISKMRWRRSTTKALPHAPKQSERNGKLRGIGVSTTVESSNAGLIEHAEIRFDPTGSVTVLVGSHDHGQGHQTAFRQIVAEKLGVDPTSVDFKWGDTDQIAIGTGTFGSRSAVAGGTAIITAAKKIEDKGKKIAAHLMEAGEHDIVFKDGKFTVAGTDKAIDISQIARDAFQPAKISERHGTRPDRERHLRRRPPHVSQRLPHQSRSRSIPVPA